MFLGVRILVYMYVCVFMFMCNLTVGGYRTTDTKLQHSSVLADLSCVLTCKQSTWDLKEADAALRTFGQARKRPEESRRLTLRHCHKDFLIGSQRAQEGKKIFLIDVTLSDRLVKGPRSRVNQLILIVQSKSIENTLLRKSFSSSQHFRIGSQRTCGVESSNSSLSLRFPDRPDGEIAAIGSEMAQWDHWPCEVSE